MLEANKQMELQKEKLLFRESEYQNANNKFEFELHDVRQELCKKTTELDGSISALNDARQKNIDLQHQNTAQQKVMPTNSQSQFLAVKMPSGTNFSPNLNEKSLMG